MLKRFRRVENDRSKKMKIHGAKECARRMKQMEAINPNILRDQMMSVHLASKLITSK